VPVFGLLTGLGLLTGFGFGPPGLIAHRVWACSPGGVLLTGFGLALPDSRLPSHGLGLPHRVGVGSTRRLRVAHGLGVAHRVVIWFTGFWIAPRVWGWLTGLGLSAQPGLDCSRVGIAHRVWIASPGSGLLTGLIAHRVWMPHRVWDCHRVGFAPPAVWIAPPGLGLLTGFGLGVGRACPCLIHRVAVLFSEEIVSAGGQVGLTFFGALLWLGGSPFGSALWETSFCFAAVCSLLFVLRCFRLVVSFPLGFVLAALAIGDFSGASPGFRFV